MARPQAEHGEMQLLEFRRLPAVQEFHESQGVIRRIALALGADDHRQQPFAGQFLERVGIGPEQTYGQAAGLGLLGQRFRFPFGIAGLAAVDNAEPFDCRRFIRNGMQRQGLPDLCMLRCQASGVAR